MTSAPSTVRPAGGDGLPVRRDRRVSALALSVDVRLKSGDAWTPSKLHDLSIGGALIKCTLAVSVGDAFELRLSDPALGEVIAVVVARPLRLLTRSDGVWAAVRFAALTPEATAGLAAVLSDALDDEGLDDKSEEAEEITAAATLTALRLHDVSVYDLFDIDPACHDGQLESRCEDLIASVADDIKAAVGRREARLKVLHASLERLRPLWNDPVKRARYDLRWGYVRAANRLRDAESRRGLDAYTLTAIWFDLYSDRVRAANRAVARARGRDQTLKALRLALDDDPFCPEKRARLASLEHGGAAAVVSAVDAPFVRGSLADVSLASLLHGVAENDADIDVVIRVGGTAVGVVGIFGGAVVTSIAGHDRGVAALRRLCAITDGTFQARYAPPREHLRHMDVPATELLDEVAPR